MNTILVVDDNLNNLDFLFDLLDSHDYEVLFATDGKSALERLNHAKPDIILLDVMMPGIDGFETCIELKKNEKTKDIPVIFMTALTDISSIVKGFQAGAVDYITKPIRQEEVLARIKTHLTIKNLQNELKLKNEKLEKLLDKEKENNKLKSKILSIASHDVRTPLSSIYLSADILEYYSSKISEEKKNNCIAGIKSSVNDIYSILDELVLYSKSDSGEIEFQPEKINIIQYIDEIVKHYNLISAETNEIFYKYSEPDLAIKIDKKLFKHILSNLLSNAIKYSPEGKPITLNCYINSDFFVLKITDNGIGIPEKDFDTLFTPFKRGSNVENIEGTGLGLSIVKELVNIHKGKIEFKSEKNKGTEFTLFFPI